MLFCAGGAPDLKKTYVNAEGNKMGWREVSGDAQDDGPALGTAYDRAHAVSVNQQGTQRPDRSAVGACRSRRRAS